MIVVGNVESDNVARIAVLLARRANASKGLIAWVTAAGTVCCADSGTQDAKHITRESPAYVIGSYHIGIRAAEIADDLRCRMKELALKDNGKDHGYPKKAAA